MKSNKGVTLVELMVVMVLTIIMLIAVGAVSGVGKVGYKKISDETVFYNDIAYGFKLIQNRVHSTNGSVSVESTTAPWIGNRLEVGNEAFGVYDRVGDRKDFVYLPDKNDTDPANYQTILTVLDTDILTSTFTVVGDKITVDIDINVGKEDIWDIDIDMSTTVIKRI